MDRLNEEKLNFITNDQRIRSLFQNIPKIASTDISILITGESGTGKEIIANFIHLASKRKENQFIAVNCAAIPPELLESELFGHKKGSFTGATSDHVGLFKIADGGTIFLDEIGDMPLVLQSKLLRIIQEKRIRPVGGKSEKCIDFRIISATHKSLKDEIKKGNFREDLYYRLSGLSFHLPPLRERPGDIRALISYLSSRTTQKYSLQPVMFSEEALTRLEGFPWPGNVRQLENVIGQMAILYQGKTINSIDVPLEDEFFPKENSFECFCQCGKLPTLDELTEKYFQFVYNRSNHHQGKAASILGVSRRTLSRKIQCLGVKPLGRLHSLNEDIHESENFNFHH